MDSRSTVAEALRAARDELGLEIGQAAERAAIPVRYARLLEGDSSVPVGVADDLYLVPFFRRYASSLGLDVARLLPEFLSLVHQPPAPSGAPLRLSYRSPLATLWKPAAALLAIAAAVTVMLRHSPVRPVVEDEAVVAQAPAIEEAALAGDAAARAAAEDPGAVGARSAAVEISAASAGAVELAPAEGTVAPTATAGAGAASAAAPTSEPPVPDVSPGGRQLRIVAEQETWLSIGIDDQPKRSLIMQPGETQIWTASRGFNLTVGNAGGVTLALDGRSLPPLGVSGQVVRNVQLPGNETQGPSGG